MEPAGDRGIDQRNTTHLDLLGDANLDLLVDALSLYYCHSLGVRKLESSGKQMAHTKTPRGLSVKSCRSLKVRRLSCTEFIPYRKEGCRVSIGRRVVVLLAMVLVAATLATMSAASAFADD